jgi:hypothetical protein
MVILGASGEPQMPGFGFRYDINERWSVPNITGLPSIFLPLCICRHTTWISTSMTIISSQEHIPAYTCRTYEKLILSA